MRRIGARILFLVASVSAAACTSTADVAPEDQPLHVELRGNRIVFNHRIVFEHDSAALVNEEDDVLNAVVALLDAHDEIFRIQVQGHTSTDGEEAHNQALSARRAETVAEYLRAHGVEQEVTSQGYGETYPRCREETDECHAENRRVEFFVDAHH